MKRKKVFAFIGALIALALLCGVVYFVYVFTDEFSTGFKTFYLEVGGVKYLKDADNLRFTDKATRIDVHYTFEKVQSKKLTFEYSLEPAGADFNFTVDGEKVSWLNVEDLEKGFNLKADTEGLTLDCENKMLLDVLQAVYPNSQIELPEIDEAQIRYKLIVSSEDKRSSIALTFGTQADKAVESITLDKLQITF